MQRLSSESKKADHSAGTGCTPQRNDSDSLPNDNIGVVISTSNTIIGSDEQSAATVQAITSEYTTLSKKFTLIASRVKRAFKTSSNVDIDELQDLIEDQCGIEPQEHTTVSDIFKRLKPHYSILNFQIIVFLVENLLKNDEVL